MTLTMEELNKAYTNYHEVNFGDVAELPKLDLMIVHGRQHTEVFVGKRSLGQAAFLLELLRREAVKRNVTLILVVPFAVAGSDYATDGFVSTPKGFCAVC